MTNAVYVSQAKKYVPHPSRGAGGMSGTATHRSWSAMMQRCFNSKLRDYKSYGAKGITVCERWQIFLNFFADMGERPAGTTLDRYPNPAGNYEPGNCRWATPLEQTLNRKNVRKNFS
jgi:hypothetical protein